MKYLILLFTCVGLIGADYALTNTQSMATRLSVHTNINIAIDADSTKIDSLALLGNVTNLVASAGWNLVGLNLGEPNIRPGVFVRVYVPNTVTPAISRRYQAASEALCDEFCTNGIAAVQVIYRPLTNGIGPVINVKIGPDTGAQLGTNMIRYADRFKAVRQVEQ